MKSCPRCAELFDMLHMRRDGQLCDLTVSWTAVVQLVWAVIGADE